MTAVGGPTFVGLFANPPDGQWVAPGRVNIIGEHTDYNDGYVLPIALPHVVTCSARRRADNQVRVGSAQHPGELVVGVSDELANHDAAGWSRYPLGVVNEFVRRRHAVSGLDLLIDGAVPVGAGLSSSASVECAVALAVRDLFEIAISDDDLVDIASTAENDYVGAPTGILDQSASVFCTAGHALFLDVATGARAQVPFDLASAGLDLLVIDTNTPHALVEGEYAERRNQCKAAAEALGVRSLREVTDTAALGAIPDGVLRRRARHVVTENARVLEVVEGLRSGKDPRLIGPILDAGHASLRDDFEVSTIQLDTAAEVAVSTGAYGARMVGGGFGGSVIALVEQSRRDAVADAVTAKFAEKNFVQPRMFVATPAAGARRLI